MGYLFAQTGRYKRMALDEQYTVSYGIDERRVTVIIQGHTNPVDMENEVRLSPDAAWKLLIWLGQESKRLEMMAKKYRGECENL
jgi:hypothetical protein